MAKKKTKKEEARMALMVDDIERMLCSDPCSLDDLSERLNAGVAPADHIAAGTIEMVLDELVKAGRAKVEGDGTQRVWRVVTDPVRRRLVMEALCALALDGDPLYIYPAARVVERIVERCQQYDREQVVAELRQLVGMRYLAAGYVLLSDTVDAVLSLGVPAWARMSLGAEPEPAEAPKPAEPVEGAHLAQVQAELLAQIRADLDAARAQVDRARVWLDEHDLDAHEILGVEAPKAKTTRKEFDWTQTRQVNDHEVSAIFREVLALDAKMEALSLEAAAAKDRYKGLMQAVRGEIAALKHAATSHSRVVSVRAYREYDWASQVERVYAVEDGRLLEERPIPHGTQREIQHELDEPASAASEPDVVEPGSDIEQAEAKAVDAPRAIVLRVVGRVAAHDDEPFDDDGDGPFGGSASGDETAHIRAEMA